MEEEEQGGGERAMDAEEGNYEEQELNRGRRLTETETVCLERHELS